MIRLHYRIFYTPSFEPLIKHTRHTLLSTLVVSETVWKARVLVQKDRGGAREEQVFEVGAPGVAGVRTARRQQEAAGQRCLTPTPVRARFPPPAVYHGAAGGRVERRVLVHAQRDTRRRLRGQHLWGNLVS